MIRVSDVLAALFDAAPAYMKMEWDNVGLLCGRRTAAVTHVMVALDPMPDVFAEAKAHGCELIVTHHPLIFQPVRAVSDESFTGENLLWHRRRQPAHEPRLRAGRRQRHSGKNARPDGYFCP